MIEAEDILGVKICYLKAGAIGGMRADVMANAEASRKVTVKKKGVVQIREYMMGAVTVMTEPNVFLVTGNVELEGIPFDEDVAIRCGFTQCAEDPDMLELRLFYPNTKFLFSKIGRIFMINDMIMPVQRVAFLHQVMQLYYDFTGKVLKPQL